MKKLLFITIISLIGPSLFSQSSKIENTRVTITPTNDTMLVNYDLAGKRAASSIKLEVKDLNNQIIQPKNIFGDIGNGIQPGKDKSIIWDMNADGLELSGSSLKVRVNGSVFIPSAKKKVWIPWLYIAAGASAGVGTYASIRANQIYEDYPPSANTDEAEKLRADAEMMTTVSRVAFGAAAAFGTAGIIVHINHNKHKSNFALNYCPSKNANLFALTYKF